MRDYTNTLLGIMAVNSIFSTPIETDINQINFSKKSAPIPKGCQEYHFDEDGEETIYPHGISFTCVASSLKSAQKKFNKFKNRKA